MVVVSKDEDFFHLANRPNDQGKLLWIRIGNCRKAALLRAVDAALPQIVAAFDQGSGVIELP
jgi:predicted nuclease of predicted toxin-antitoxin system